MLLASDELGRWQRLEERGKGDTRDTCEEGVL